MEKKAKAEAKRARRGQTKDDTNDVNPLVSLGLADEESDDGSDAAPKAAPKKPISIDTKI